MPTLITGYESYQVGLSWGYGRVIGDAPVQGLPVFRRSEDFEASQSFRLNAGALWAERWQIGVELPWVNRFRNTHSGSGIGDIGLVAGVEAFYSPRTFFFIKGVMPTGRSEYDSQDISLSDVTGRGLWLISTGALIMKDWGIWSASIMGEIHQGWSRATGDLVSAPGWGGSVGLAGAVNPGRSPVQLGVSLAPLYQAGASGSQPRLVWNTGAQVSYFYDLSWSASLSYTDQTLIGPVTNTALMRSVGFLVQRSFE